MEVVPTAPEVATQQTAPGGVDRGEGVQQRFDIVVIGGGPGGYATALYASAAGLSVAVVELDKVGGTCLHRGCVPASWPEHTRGGGRGHPPCPVAPRPPTGRPHSRRGRWHTRRVRRR